MSTETSRDGTPTDTSDDPESSETGQRRNLQLAAEPEEEVTLEEETKEDKVIEREVGYKCGDKQNNYLDETDRAWNRLDNPIFFRMGYYN